MFANIVEYFHEYIPKFSSKIYENILISLEFTYDILAKGP